MGNAFGTWWAFVVAAAAAVVVVFPLIWMLSASLKPEGQIVTAHPGLFPHSVTFANYSSAWTAIDFPRLLLNTTVFAGGVTLLAVLFDSLTAYALACLEFPGRKVVFVLILITLMVPFQVNLVPLYIELASFHWVNTYQGLILPRATDAFGIFFLRQFFMSIPSDLDDSARIDGAGDLRIYRSLMMRLAWPAVLTLALFVFMANWNDLLWPLIISTSTSMYTLSAGIALFTGQHVILYGLVMAGTTMSILPMVIAFVLVQRRFVESIATTGLR